MAASRRGIVKRLSLQESLLRRERKESIPRGYQLFIRYMERHGLADLISHFPCDMTLGRFRTLRENELSIDFNITNKDDFHKVMMLIEKTRGDDESDKEVLTCV